MRVLLISTYELGRQPFGLASPAAWLLSAGCQVTCADLSRDKLDPAAVATADVVGFYLPMHTATRLALPVIGHVKDVNRAARVCAFGLYAPLNAERLTETGVEAVFGGEFEGALTQWVTGDRGQPAEARRVPRLAFRVPDRSGLPPLNRYASLQLPDGSRRTAGYTEASRGCKHHCRHCPIVPVYGGTFRTVAPDVVVADVRAQVEAGAHHITFGDPDFFNGIGHARAVLDAFGREFPGITYDVTIKVEHLLRHADALPMLAGTGCVLVTSAVESFDDAVLLKLRKGHTREDFLRALDLCRAAGLPLAPTFIPFTPWTTGDGHAALLREIARLDLVGQVSPIQLAIRLLIPNGSPLLELDDIRAVADPFDPATLVHPWRHHDARMDALQGTIERLVAELSAAPRHEVFARVWDVVADATGSTGAFATPAPASRVTVPYLTEPWYC